MIRFDGRVAIVTGGGRGLGRSHALELARRGAIVVVNDVGSATLAGSGSDACVAEEVVDEISRMGGRASADASDVADATAVDAMVEQVVRHWGRLDIVVNNAGNQRFLKFGDTTRADYDALLDIHLGGSFNVTRAAWPHMVRVGYGRVVFTTSQVGFYGQVDAVAYGSAKAGLIGLMHGMKLGSLQHGIRVNCLSPFAYTRMVAGLFPEVIAEGLAPEHVSAAVAYLASEGCTLNGEVLIAGGGHFAIARTIETRGIDIESLADITADTIEARLGAITDVSEPYLYPDALAAVQVTFDRLTREAGR